MTWRCRSRARSLPHHLDPTAVASTVCERYTQAGIREIVFGVPGPLDEGDPRRTDVIRQQLRILVLEPREPVQVEVRDDCAAGSIAVTDAEARAGHRVGDAKRTGGASHQRRLAGA